MKIPLVLLLLLCQEEKGTSPCRPLKPGGTLLENYEFSDRDFPWTLRGRELSFPSALPVEPEENKTVWARYWRPKEPGRHPALVLLHWLGGSFDALEMVGARFADNGVCALLVYLPHYGKRRVKGEAMIGPSVEKTLRNFRQAVLDVRRAGDWLASRPEVDPARVGVLGVSLGAIVGALSAGVDRNFSHAILVIGGGDLASILFHESESTKEAREELRKLGYTPERVREEWKSIDPVTFAGRIPPDSVLMFNAESDEIIPRASTERLHEALGRPRIEWFRGGHYAVVTQLGRILRETLRFLKGPPRLRVLLAENQESLDVEIGAEWVAFRAGTDEELSSGAAGRIPITPRTVENGPVLYVPRTSGALRIGKLSYHGSLLLVPAKGRFHVINVVDLERYVMGVLGPEIGKNAPAEAQKAQAVAARTYAYVMLVDRKAETFDVYADVRDQVYRGVPTDEVYVRAVEATSGELLFYKEAPLKTYFHSTCGGRTESVFDWRKEKEIEPLSGGPCGFCDGAKWATWSVRLTPDEISAALKRPVPDVTVRSTTKSGRVKEVAIGDFAMAATDFRASLGYDKIRSTNFTVKRDGRVFVFSGRGWGHGVGMCQEGAIGMAQSGRNHREILARYYPGATIEKR